ncbi:MAG: hypothetical protein CMP07_00295 [Xanthomonadales bacterium]|nr:hypothetical protein [Xanthomonadales bacterium]
MTRDAVLAIGDAVRFPLRPDVRPWVLAAAGAGALIEMLAALPLPSIAGLIFGIFLLAFRILVWITVYRVASEILLASAEGDTGAPSFRTVESADGLAVRHIGLWLVATVSLVLLSIYFGVAGVLLGSIAIAAVLPAATIILTLSKSLFEALVPTQWLRLAARIGHRDYLKLYAALLGAALVYLAVAGLLGWLGAGRGLRNVIQLAYWTFAVFGWFHLAGRAVFLHRAELNLVEPDTEVERAPERFTRDAETLWRQIREQGGTREMHAELARQLERGGDRQTRLEHGRMHIEALLLSFEQPGEALDRAQRMLSADPDFCLERPETMRMLITAARDQDVGRLAGILCGSYLKRFPNSAKGNEVRLLGCEALAENASWQRENAKRWFRELMTAELDDEQRGRLSTIAPRYLGAPSKPG